MPNRYERFKKHIRGKADVYVDYIPVLGPNTELTKITGIDVLLNSFSNMLRTPKGTDIEDPEYGSNLARRVFEPADEITIDNIIEDIEETAFTYDERISVTGVNVNFLRTGNKKGFSVDVTIVYNNEERTSTMYYDEDTYFQFFTQDDS